MPKPERILDPVRKKIICNLIAAAWFQLAVRMQSDDQLTKDQIRETWIIAGRWLTVYADIQTRNGESLFAILGVGPTAAQNLHAPYLAAYVATATDPKSLSEAALKTAIAADEAAIKAMEVLLLGG